LGSEPRGDAGHRWQVLGVVAVGFMAGILPSGSFVVAIPALLAEFHAAPGSGPLVMTIFMVSNTIAMLPTPWLIQRFGIRRCFLGTMTLLVLTSVLGAVSPDFGFLIVVRALQGIGTGTLMPLSGILIVERFESRDRGRAAGIMGLAMTLAPAIGPTLGGLMVDAWGWRSVSLLPLPLALIAWVAAWRWLPARDEDVGHRFDFRGMFLLSVLTLSWLGLVSYAAQPGVAQAWIMGSFALLLGLSIAAFARHARRVEKPLIGPGVWRHRRVVMGALVAFVLGFHSYGAVYLVPIYLQVAQGMSATRAGAALMPGTVALALTSPIVGFLHDLLSPRQLMAAGMAVLAGSWLFLGGFATRLSYAGFILCLLLSRVGFAFVNTPMTQAALSELTGDVLGQAAALLGYVRQLGGVFGIAALAVFVQWRSSQLAGAEALLITPYAEGFLLVGVMAAGSLAAVWRL